MVAVASSFPAAVEQWRPLAMAVFPVAAVEDALCVIQHESGGLPAQAFDEWTYWWGRHPNETRTVDYPRPPRDTVLGAGGDSRYSVGLFQINVGNLAWTRISALNGWIPPVVVAGVPGPYRATQRFGPLQAHKILLDPSNNVSAAHTIWAAGGWLPAWNADREACGLS